MVWRLLIASEGAQERSGVRSVDEVEREILQLGERAASLAPATNSEEARNVLRDAAELLRAAASLHEASSDPSVEHLGSLRLTRRTYEVLRDREEFIVRSEGTRGQAFEQRLPESLVNEVGDALAGKRVRNEDAAREAASHADRGTLPEGYQARYYGQDILVVLTVLGRAAAQQEGRAWYYQL